MFSQHRNGITNHQKYNKEMVPTPPTSSKTFSIEIRNSLRKNGFQEHTPASSSENECTWPTVRRLRAREINKHLSRSQRVPTHRRWNRKSFVSSFTKILSQLPPEDFENLMIAEIHKKPTHRRWNRQSIFSSFTKILNEINLEPLPVQ